jgi:hypothetical protein
MISPKVRKIELIRKTTDEQILFLGYAKQSRNGGLFNWQYRSGYLVVEMHHFSPVHAGY